MVYLIDSIPVGVYGLVCSNSDGLTEETWQGLRKIKEVLLRALGGEVLAFLCRNVHGLEEMRFETNSHGDGYRVSPVVPRKVHLRFISIACKTLANSTATSMPCDFPLHATYLHDSTVPFCM